MKKINIETAIKRFNDIMILCGYEHNTIGTGLSENTDKWNIRDMVSEAQYVLDLYYEDGNVNGEMRYSEEEYDRKAWKSHTGKLKRFIKAYEPFIENVICTENHSSKYDNN